MRETEDNAATVQDGGKKKETGEAMFGSEGDKKIDEDDELSARGVGGGASDDEGKSGSVRGYVRKG